MRAVCGLATREIAHTLLLPEATIAQRISRAKASITRSEEPFRRPPRDLIDDRLPAVMHIIYLIFNEGHSATSGSSLIRVDLGDEAIRLARQLHQLLSDQPEYQLQAAIAAVHDQAGSFEDTDWTQLRALYNQLADQSDSHLVRLNRAVATAHTDGPEAAFEEIDALGTSLIDYHRFHATLGYLHELAGEHEAARRAFGDAARLATNGPERQFLQGRAES